jgi:hypothetical protein
MAAVVSAVFLAGCDMNLTAIILSPATGSIEVTQGDEVLFQGRAIFGMPFTTLEGDAEYGYSWSTDRNEVVDGSTAEESATVKFAQPGTYTVSLTVTDKEQERDTATVTVYVKSISDAITDPLEAVILSPAVPSLAVFAGNTVGFRGEGVGGLPFGAIEGEEVQPYAYFWDVLNIPGVTTDDDVDYTDTETFKDVDVTFNQAGVYNVSFSVRDSRGVVATSVVTVTVQPAEQEQSEE